MFEIILVNGSIQKLMSLFILSIEMFVFPCNIVLLNCAGKITIKKVTISIQSLMQLRLTEGL